MSRTQMPLSVGDITSFARSLKHQLSALDRTPGHVEMLNMLSRASGFRNFQHFRAQCDAREQLDRNVPEPESVDYVKVKRLLRFFDAQGRLIRWPKKYNQRILCLWVIWSHIPARQDFFELKLNERLNALHVFGDHALLRRELVDQGFMVRTPDGRSYRRLERRPPADALELMKRCCQ
ncbi:DUF2087 domain-containing protein [Desulfovibrio inopinatus]|uniref:DUF2087 domain-containing protein n=1 Tax=Desulfovibrio inopinatus TaxID=102109 RepID=UPI0003F62148|nr:DUF2087 domain-containing protein [Desulfovibrio inopinatus]